VTTGQVPDAPAPADPGPVRLRDRIVEIELPAPGALVSDQLVEFHREVSHDADFLVAMSWKSVPPVDPAMPVMAGVPANGRGPATA
jgi:hypothetical protein